jgi:arylsulfatase A-like enzyme
MEGAYDPAALALRLNCADTPQARQDLADYYAHVTALDTQIARLVDCLEKTGQLDDTLVVYSSDHGTLLESHDHRYKQWPYEESIGIPLIARFGDRLSRGHVDDLLLGIVDYAPTLLGLLDVPVPAEMQGRDCSSYLVDPAADRSDAPVVVYLQETTAGDQAVAQGMVPWRGVRTVRYTYARSVHGAWLAFDSQEDPYQLRNLVHEPASAAVCDALDQTTQAWISAAGDALEPVDAFMAREGLAAAWAEREAVLHRPGNMSGSPGA